MRYIIETTQEGNDNKVWNTINALQEKELITIVEKGDPIENMKENLRKIAKAMELLEKIGINKEIMESYIYDKTKVSKTNIKAVLNEQSRFFEKMGIELK